MRFLPFPWSKGAATLPSVCIHIWAQPVQLERNLCCWLEAVGGGSIAGEMQCVLFSSRDASQVELDMHPPCVHLVQANMEMGAPTPRLDP